VAQNVPSDPAQSSKSAYTSESAVEARNIERLAVVIREHKSICLFPAVKQFVDIGIERDMAFSVVLRRFQHLSVVTKLMANNHTPAFPVY